MIDEIPSAFPVLPPPDPRGGSAAGYPYPEAGMSLRDWFAGQALAGILAYRSLDQYGAFIQGPRVAERAYLYADAMLKAREVSHD